MQLAFKTVNPNSLEHFSRTYFMKGGGVFLRRTRVNKEASSFFPQNSSCVNQKLKFFSPGPCKKGIFGPSHSWWLGFCWAGNFILALGTYLDYLRAQNCHVHDTHPWQSTIIADVAVTKRHQRQGEIRVIFTSTSSKSCFLKNCHSIYTPSTLNGIQFAQHTLARLLKYARFTQHTRVSVRNAHVADRRTTLLIAV